MTNDLLASIRTELLELTKLHHRVMQENDTVGRIFAGLRKTDTPAPTWDELRAAQVRLEARVPGFFLYYFKEDQSYGLIPNPDWKPEEEGEDDRA